MPGGIVGVWDRHELAPSDPPADSAAADGVACQDFGDSDGGDHVGLHLCDCVLLTQCLDMCLVEMVISAPRLFQRIVYQMCAPTLMTPARIAASVNRADDTLPCAEACTRVAHPTLPPGCCSKNMQWRNVPVKREIRKKIRFLLREPFCGGVRGCARAPTRACEVGRGGEDKR